MHKCQKAVQSIPTWRTRIPGVRNAIIPPQTTRPNPLVVRDKLFASLFAPGLVCAVARESGEVLWVKALDSYASSSVLLQNRVLYATSNRTLYSLNPNNGKVNWEFSPQTANGEWIYSQPVVRAGRVFIGDRCGDFHCLDAKTGKQLWRRRTSRGCNNQVNSTALVVGDRVITANNEGAVICYSVDSGNTIWRRRIDGGCIGELLHHRTTVIVAGASLIAIDCRTGDIRKKLKFPGKSVASVTLAGSRIATILGTDFHSQPSAWQDPSAFHGELVIQEGSREITRRRVSGTPYLRTCDETGLVYAANFYGMSVFDPSDGSRLITRRGEIALPTFSHGVLYGLTREGVLFAEPRLPRSR